MPSDEESPTVLFWTICWELSFGIRKLFRVSRGRGQIFSATWRTKFCALVAGAISSFLLFLLSSSLIISTKSDIVFEVMLLHLILFSIFLHFSLYSIQEFLFILVLFTLIERKSDKPFK